MNYFCRLDRYIIKQFLLGFAFTLLLIVSIAITIDIGEHIDKFLKNDLSFKQVATEFYLNFIPYIIALLGPYFVFITVVFFTSQLAGRSEIVAMFNSGMSFKRFLFPYVFSSTLIAILLWIANNYVVPNTNKKRLAFENKYIAYQPVLSSDHLHRKINDSTYVYFRIYDNSIKTATTVSVEEISNGVLKSKYLAERAVWDTLTQTWTLKNYIKRQFDNGKEILTKGESMNTGIVLDPTVFVKRWTYIEELNRTELIDKIADLKAQGVENTADFESELYRRTANCFGIIILTVIGATLASKKIRGGMGVQLMIGITLCSVFEVIQKFSISFAIKAHLFPLLAVWIPNIIFMLIAIVLWQKYQEN